MKKRGQSSVGLSFGMIFSIILIVAIVVAIFIGIRYFLNTGECIQVGETRQSFEEDITDMWRKSPRLRRAYPGEDRTLRLPSSITHMCFGRLEQPARNTNDASIQENLREERATESNVFFFPPDQACNGELSSFQLDHVQIDNFFCESTVNGKIEIHLHRDSQGDPITLEP